jgi:outer membrane receptor protein involved in Fe transport
VAGSQGESLRFKEKALAVSVTQLISKELSVGARYRLSHAALDDELLDVAAIAPASGLVASQRTKATLHQLRLFALFNHPSGIFSEADAVWSSQSNSGYSPDQPGDNFWQFNAFIGYRFPRRFVELSLGVLNITDRDYRLNPLTLYSELPRERTAVVTLKINF